MEKWRQILAVKCSHIIFIILGLELPYSTSEKLPLTHAAYPFVGHLIISGVQLANMVRWYASGRAVMNFRTVSSLVTFNLSGVFPIVVMVELVFVARKNVVKYEQKLAKFVSDVQQRFGQEVDYPDTYSLNVKFFCAEIVLICWSVYYPLLFLRWYSSRAVLGTVQTINFHFFTQTSIKTYLQIWRLNCLAVHLNRQLKNKFSYQNADNSGKYDMDDVINNIRDLVDLVRLFCQTVSLQVCAQIILINGAILQSFSYILNPSLRQIFEQEYQFLAACMFSVGCCFLFALQVFRAQIADVTVATLKQSAKISYKIYLTYPDVVNDKKLESSKRKLLWLSRGTMTQNVRFSMGGVFDLGSHLIFRMAELSSTYLLFLMQYN